MGKKVRERRMGQFILLSPPLSMSKARSRESEESSWSEEQHEKEARRRRHVALPPEEEGKEEGKEKERKPKRLPPRPDPAPALTLFASFLLRISSFKSFIMNNYLLHLLYSSAWADSTLQEEGERPEREKEGEGEGEEEFP